MKRHITALVLTLILALSVFTMASCMGGGGIVEPDDGIEDEIPGGNGGGEIDDITEYTVSFDSNGGSAIESQKVTEGKKASKPKNPTREGYTFDGWFYGDEEWSFIGYVVTDDMTLTASWSVVDYTIEYIDVENTGSYVTEYNIESSNIVLPKPQITGFEFLGWTWEGQSVPIENAIIKTGSTGNLTFTAHWDTEVYYITYVGVDDTSNYPTTYCVESDDIPLPTPTKTGHAFLGWTWEGQQTPVNSVKIPSGSTGDMTYIANWQEGYTVTYVTNGGDDMSPEFVTPETPLTPATREGYTFGGWYLTSDLSGEVITQVIDSDITVYAYWIEETKPSYFETIVWFEGVVICGYKYGIPTEVVIPAYIDGRPVVSIGDSAFRDCSVVEKIVIPENVTNIEYQAFHSCTSLKSVYLPSSLSYVGPSAFSNDTKLENVHIKDLSSWCNIEWELSSSMIDGLYPDTYGGTSPLDYAKNLYINDKLVSDVVIPDGVTDISFAFRNYEGLNSIVINDKMTFIPRWAFSGCTGLTSITIPDNIIKIGSEAFRDCTNLKDVYINSTVGWYNIEWELTPQLGYSELMFDLETSPLYYAENLYVNGHLLSDAIIPSTITDISYSFSGYTGLKSIILHNNITDIKEYAFFNCSGLTNVAIPSNVKSVGYKAFGNCSSLESVTIPNSVTSIGDCAFYDCSSLTSITIGNGVTSIGGYAFNECTSLESVYISDIAAWCNISFSFRSNPLYYADSLYLNGEPITELTIPEGVTTIPGYAFSCKNIESVTIPDSITSIGESAFSGCSSLKNVYIDDITAWCNINYGDTISNPLCYADSLYLNGELITELTIPEGVTTIPGYAFSCKNVTSVTISKSVISIGNNAFYGCSSLKDVIIHEGVTFIGHSTFADCSSLKNITIPKSVSYIAYSAFYGCSNLENVHIDDIAAWCNISAPGGIYSNLMSYADCLYLKGKLITELVIPDGVTSIPDYAFNGQSSITSVTIPKGVTSIGDYAFADCSNLESVIISDGVTSIGDYAFKSCHKLQNIILPNSLVQVARTAFWDCDHLYTEYENGRYIGDGENPYAVLIGPYEYDSTTFTINENTKIISNNAFRYCDHITRIIIPNGVTIIGQEAFYGCSSLTSVTIGNGVTSIGRYAFYGCSSLESITIPDSVTSIDSYAFYNCSSLKSINIPDSVTSIDSYAFYNCSSLISVTIPDSVTSIGNRIFYGCGSLAKITIPSTVTGHIREWFGNEIKDVPESLTEIVVTGESNVVGVIFDGCTNLTSITIPNSVIRIKTHQFSGCIGLTNITIGDSVEIIGDSAFYDCTGLTNLKIGDNVTYIGGSAFYGCTALTDVAIGNDVTSIGYYAFKGCTSLESIIIPDSVTTIESEAFYGCSNLKSVTFGSGVAYVGSEAFYNCHPDLYTEYEQCVYIGDANNPYAVLIETIYKKAETYNINEQTQVLGYDAFSFCSRMTKIRIPDSVIGIGDYAFRICSSLREIVLPGKVTIIGDSAFYNCCNLVNVIVPESIVSIDRHAFSECSNIKYNEFDNALYLGNDENPYVVLIKAKNRDIRKCVINLNTKIIYDSAFSGCSHLEEIILPEGLKNISNSAFTNCTSLTKIKIPDSVTVINSDNFYGSWTFMNCSNLTSVVITDGFSVIGNGMFSGCSNLDNVVIGRFINEIGHSAFDGCISLSNVYYMGTCEEWDSIDVSTNNGKNENLTSATIYFYSETAPTESGNFWHYVDGEIVVWPEYVAE